MVKCGLIKLQDYDKLIWGKKKKPNQWLTFWLLVNCQRLGQHVQKKLKITYRYQPE
jgi:hypothetical protein